MLKDYILTAIQSKRVQGLAALVLIHFFPNLNLSAIGIDLKTLAEVWTGYGVLSAQGAALPNLKGLFGLFTPK